MVSYIHIGHGKTGTSAIQSYLAKARLRLADLGFDYPEHTSFEVAKKGWVTAGNGFLCLEDDFRVSKPSIFSSETLFHKLSTPGALKSVVDRIDGPVTVICYTRDLVDLATSVWGQRVKRGGETRPLDQFLSEDDSLHYEKLDSMFAIAAEAGAKLILRNYSRRSDKIVEDFLEIILGERASSLLEAAPLTATPVNRSLTSSETAFQAAFNRHFGDGASGFIGDMLVNELPDIPVSKPTMKQETYAALLDRYGPAIERINRKIDPAEAIRLQDPEEAGDAREDTGEYRFSPAQLEVLARSIASEIRDSGLVHDDGAVLLSVARKFEAKRRPALKEAISLLELAQKARPRGRVIRDYLAHLVSLRDRGGK